MKRPALICAMLAATIWTVYGLTGAPMANAAAARFGRVLLKLGEGKFSSAADFLHHRFFEAAWLLTLILLWILLHGAIHLIASRSNRLRRNAWIAQALVGFLALNLWVSQASHTAAFWLVYWDGMQTQNLTRFHLKMILAREERAARRAALVGSSQTRAQIDEAVLNGMLGSRLRTTDLAYPGSKALDVLLMQDLIDATKPDYVIWYVSEAVFYGGSASEVIPNFVTLRHLPDLIRRDAIQFVSAEYLGAGVMGAVLPVFRFREVFTQRVFGPQIGSLQQEQYDAALEADLSARAQRAASPYHVDKESQMHERAMEDFIRRCEGSQQTVILLAGQLHPAFQDALNPAIRPQMMAFLRLMQTKHANVILIEHLPEQSSADYIDLTHVDRPAQNRFSNFLGSKLDTLLAQSLDRRP